MDQNKGPWRIDEIPAFCLTLERRADRWKRFQDQYGIDALPKLKRFLGVDGKTIDIKTDPRISTFTKRNIIMKTRRSHDQLDTVGGVGCALSHTALWKWLAESDQEMLLVFEDDAVIPPDFVQRANQLIQSSPTLQNPNKWDMWIIGAKWDTLSKIPGETKIGLVEAPAFFLFHCYIITRKFAQKLYENCLPIEGHIDFWASNYAIINKSHIVATPKLQLFQREAKSDIQTTVIPSLVDVPTDYEKTHTFISKTDLMLARGAEAAVILFLGYLAVS
jgi:GR25 family glycosyltransferase involved in LPS biosynthesis